MGSLHPGDFAKDADFSVDVASQPEDIQSLEREWRMLHRADPDSGIFLGFDWISALIERKKAEPRIYVIRDGLGRAVCILPLYDKPYRSRTTGRTERVLYPAGRLSLSEYTGFLCKPGMESRALQMLARYMANEDWYRLSIRYEPTGRRAEIFANAFSRQHFRVSWPEYLINKGTTDCLTCPVLALPGDFDTYLSKSIGRATRKNFRRARRKHLRSGELQISSPSPSRIQQDIDITLSLWKAQWSPELGNSRVKSSLRRYADFLDLAAQQDALLINVIRRGDQPLAAHASLMDLGSKRIICKISTRDPDEATPVGLLLDMHQIEWAIDNHFKAFDFGHGNAAYKYSFGAVDQPLKYLKIRRRSGQ